MSNQQPHPITTSAFATALTALPLSSLHAKAAELRNSLHHLRSSNVQLRSFLAEQGSRRGDWGGDGDGSGGIGNEDEEDTAVYTDAIVENESLMARLVVRIGLLRREVVEVRGMAWVSGDGDEDDYGDGEADGGGGGDGDGDGRSGLIEREGGSGAEVLINGEREGRGVIEGGRRMEDGDERGAHVGAGVGTETRSDRAVNGMIDDAHSGHNAGLQRNMEQPDQRLTDEELQQRLRDRLGDRQDRESDGVHL